MAPFTFPPELLDSICCHLPTNDLLAVARANYTLNAVAQRTLYRSISITPAANNLSVLSTLAARPHTATHVRTFSLTVHNEQPHTFYTLLAKALEHMSELTSLSLVLDADASWVLNSGTRYLSLASFASSFPLDSNLADFLSRTPAIVELQVGSALANDQSEINFPPASIPNLASFTGPHNTARLVVPHRPVEALFLSEVISDDSIFGQLSLSTSNITIFDAVVDLGLLQCVAAISQTMPSLHYLRLMTVAPLDEHFDPVRRHCLKLIAVTSHHISFSHPVSLPAALRRPRIHAGSCFFRILWNELDMLERFRLEARLAIKSSHSQLRSPSAAGGPHGRYRRYFWFLRKYDSLLVFFSTSVLFFPWLLAHDTPSPASLQRFPICSHLCPPAHTNLSL